MYKCPICKYSDQKKSSVKAHLTASVAGEHEGMSGRNDHDMIKEIDSEPAREPDREPDTGDEPTEQADSGAELSSPAWPDGGGEETDEQVCEKCGNDVLYEPDAVLRSKWGQNLSATYRKEVRESDAVCLDCGALMDFD
jgi:hypothetical protein